MKPLAVSSEYLRCPPAWSRRDFAFSIPEQLLAEALSVCGDMHYHDNDTQKKLD